MHRVMLSNMVIDCDDFEAGIRFWSEALGVKVELRDEDYAYLEDLPGNYIGITLQKVPEQKTSKGRLHLDLMSDNIEAEAQRLEKLGARRQGWVHRWLVMEDPCGNEFCIVPHTNRSDFDQLARTVE